MLDCALHERTMQDRSNAAGRRAERRRVTIDAVACSSDRANQLETHYRQ
jgi:hypothetical protein